MGKKSRTRIRWTSVHVDPSLCTDDHESGNGGLTSPGSSNESLSVPNKHYISENRRRWINSPMPPRFERKAAAAEFSHGGASTIIYNGEVCETEDLPNGFTKIRSKNLDVLFRRDYYATKPVKSTPVVPEMNITEENDHGHASDNAEEVSKEEEEESDEEEAVITNNKRSSAGSTPPIRSNLNGSSSPFYPSYSYTPGSSSPYAAPAVRPSLYLYSPSLNKMIPCAEVVIPGGLVGPDGNAVYGSPGTSVYVAAAMPYESPQHQAAASFGFPPSNYVLAFNNQSPYNAPFYSTYYGSSSDVGSNVEPSSADSTVPHSPPDLSAYNPANWAQSYSENTRIQQIRKSTTTKNAASSSSSSKQDEKDLLPVLIPGLPPILNKKVQKKKRKRRLAAGHRPGPPLSSEEMTTAAQTEERIPSIQVSKTEDLSQVNTNRDDDGTEPQEEDSEEAVTIIVTPAESSETAAVTQCDETTDGGADNKLSSNDDSLISDKTPNKDDLSTEQNNNKKEEAEDVLTDHLAQVATTSTAATDDVPESVQKDAESEEASSALSQSQSKMLYSSVVSNSSEEQEQSSRNTTAKTFVPEKALITGSSISNVRDQSNKSEWRESSRRKSRKSKHHKSRSLNTQEVHTNSVQSTSGEVVTAPSEDDTSKSVLEMTVTTTVEESTGEKKDHTTSAVVVDESNNEHEISDNNTAVPRKKSTLKKKKKRSEVETTEKLSSIKPVLIQDGAIEIGGYRRIKRASEILDGHQIDQAVRKGHLDTLFISQIGSGIGDGPMTSGRLLVGKYSPPDRSDEVKAMVSSSVQQHTKSSSSTNDKPDLTLD